MDTGQLAAMKNADITKIDPKMLVDIKSVKIDTELPMLERLQSYIEQIRNPYCFLCDGIVVKIDYAPTECTLEERLAGYISQKNLHLGQGLDTIVGV